MSQEDKKSGEPKKGFFARLAEKIDKKLQGQAKAGCCSGQGAKPRGGSCCS